MSSGGGWGCRALWCFRRKIRWFGTNWSVMRWRWLVLVVFYLKDRSGYLLSKGSIRRWHGDILMLLRKLIEQRKRDPETVFLIFHVFFSLICFFLSFLDFFFNFSLFLKNINKSKKRCKMDFELWYKIWCRMKGELSVMVETWRWN